MGKFSMKKLVLYLLAIMVTGYLLGGIVMLVSPKSLFNAEKSNYNIDDEISSSVDNVNNIDIIASSADINLIPTDDSSLKAHFYGNAASISGFQKPELQCYINSDTLYVDLKSKPNMSFGFFSSNLKLDVYIPSFYKENLKLTTSSGEIDMQNLVLSGLECTSSSGSTNLQNITADEFIQSSSSGSLKADKLKTKTSRLSSSSGSKRLTDFTGNLNSSSSSGSTYVKYSEFNSNVKINSSSGSVKIILPSNAEFSLEADSSSGGIDCDFPITITEKVKRNLLKGTVGDGNNSISIRTSSGGIDIVK